MYHYQSSGVWILDLQFFVATHQSVKINRVCAQMCYVSWKLNLKGKIQTLKYWRTANYSKYIIWWHSIITLRKNDQNLNTPSPLICTCLILILYFYGHLLQSASVNTTKNIPLNVFVIQANTDGINLQTKFLFRSEIWRQLVMHVLPI